MHYTIIITKIIIHKNYSKLQKYLTFFQNK